MLHQNQLKQLHYVFWLVHLSLRHFLIFVFRKKILNHKEEIQEKVMIGIGFIFAIALMVGFFALLIFIVG